MADGNGPRYKAPATIHGLPPEASRALVATLRELETALARGNTDVVDRRQKTGVRVQPNQIIRASNGTAVLPHPAPARAQRCTVVVEVAPVLLTAEGKALINGVTQLRVDSVGALEAVSTGEAWWLIGNGILLTAQASDLPPGATGPRGLPGEAGATGSSGIPGGMGFEGLPGVPGQPGSVGATGASGVPGGWGIEGMPGVPGARGDRGFDGSPGVPGLMGFDGLAGPPGASGAPGETGPTGPSGPMGPPGIDGEDGLPGPPGPDGATGATGETGPAGTSGGGAGTPGAMGYDGLPGVPGAPGGLGPQGFPGVPGLFGDMGLAGVPGAPGTVGATGATGATGPAGSVGAGLISFIDVNLGTVPLWSGTFNITGLSGLTIGDHVLVTRGIGAGGVSGEPEDEAQESVAAAGKVTSATTIMVQWESVNGPIAGTRRFLYAQLTGNQGDDFTSVQRADSDLDNASALLSVIPTFNASRHRTLVHETFCGVSEKPPWGGFRPWGTAKVSQIPSTAGNPGFLRVTVPLGGTGGLCMGGRPNAVQFDPAQAIGWRAIVRLNTANPGDDYDTFIGFGEDIASSTFGTDALRFNISGAGGAMTTTRRNGGTNSTSGTLATITAGNKYVFDYLSSPGGTTWEAFVNGVSVGSGSTNTPTAVMNFGMRITDDTGGTTDFSVDVDEFCIFQPNAQRFT